MEYLFGRSGFQGFLLVGGLVVGLVRLGAPEHDSYVIWSIVAFAASALVIFAAHMVMLAGNPRYQAAAEAARGDSMEGEWPSRYDVRVARGFMIFGLLIYMGYHFLDVYVVTGEGRTQRISWILQIRAGISVFIGFLWALSFFEWFRRSYVGVVTFAVTVAGIGVGAMLFLAGPEIHFYYEGFIQIIAFAAFAFRLPWRAVAFVCLLMVLLYSSVTAAMHWETGWWNLVPSLQAEIANNLVSLLTFTVLAIVASAALHPQTRAELRYASNPLTVRSGYSVPFGREPSPRSRGWPRRRSRGS